MYKDREWHTITIDPFNVSKMVSNAVELLMQLSHQHQGQLLQIPDSKFSYIDIFQVLHTFGQPCISKTPILSFMCTTRMTNMCFTYALITFCWLATKCNGFYNENDVLERVNYIQAFPLRNLLNCEKTAGSKRGSIGLTWQTQNHFSLNFLPLTSRSINAPPQSFEKNVVQKSNDVRRANQLATPRDRF